MKKILSDKKIIIMILSIILVLVVMSSTTYALFFKVHTMDNTESYTAGILDIKVEEGSKLELVNSLPITDEEGANLTPYTFTITNVGNLTYTFDLKLLSTTTENQINPNYIKIKLDDKPVLLSSLSEGLIAEDLTLNPEESITMSIRIWLSIDTPNTEIGKTFSAKIVTDGVGSEYIPAQSTLNKLGLTVNKGTPNFMKTAQESCSDEGACETTNGIYEIYDDLGTSYYFRGEVENNYVKFAGFYWRIIRINGDGTIRIIYDGTSAHVNGEATFDKYVDTSNFNDEYNNNAYAGYMYGNIEGNTYEDVHANIYDSTIKKVVDKWYKINIEDKGYNDYVTDAIYCNDRSVYSGTGIGTSTTYYMPRFRIYNQKNPSLVCKQENDKFTVSDDLGNGDLTYPVGLITVDEVSLAGGVYSVDNTKYYLYTGGHYRTISPNSFYDSGIWMWRVVHTGALGGSFAGTSTNTYGVRPVISLNKNTKFIGNGTMDSPFEVVS